MNKYLYAMYTTVGINRGIVSAIGDIAYIISENPSTPVALIESIITNLEATKTAIDKIIKVLREDL